MIDIHVKADDLLKWARLLEKIPRKIPSEIAKAMNTAGDRIFENTVAYIAEQYQMSVDDVAPMIRVHKATPDNLEWAIDASDAYPFSENSFAHDRDEDHLFSEGQLFKVLIQDEAACPVCQEVAAASPYSMEEVREIADKWKDYVPKNPAIGPRTNLVHPNCRCTIAGWQATRPLPATISGVSSLDPPGQDIWSTKQIGEMVGKAMKALMRVG